MTKENVQFSLAGLLLGLVVGFFYANSVNQRGAVQIVQAGQQNPGLPADHPPLPANAATGQAGASMAEVQAAVQKAKDNQKDFDAQLKAAELYYKIQRYDEALAFLTKANELRPDNYEAIVNLGNANFDARRYEAAEKWYAVALAKNPHDVNVRTDLGLTFFFREPPDLNRAIKEYRSSLERDPDHVQTLQNLTVALTRKGEAGEAQATLDKLAGINPADSALPVLRTELGKLRPSKTP